MFQRYVISFDVRVPTEKKREREERRENIPTTSTRVDRSILIQAKEQQKEENPYVYILIITFIDLDLI